MEEQTTWKGHGFTLLTFTGIVVLCSIFFILGMLVGRGQGQRIAGVAAAAGLEEKAPPQPDTEFGTPPELSGKEKVPVLEVPSKPESATPEPPPRVEKVPPPLPALSPSADLLNYQISALRKSSDAEKLLSGLKKKGFRAFILAPSAAEKNPLYRVQVGPYSDKLEAEKVKKQLESAGYRPILKK